MRMTSGMRSDLMEFLPVLIAVLLGIVVVGAIIAVVLKCKQSSGPLKSVMGRVIDKVPANQGSSRILIQCMDGSRISVLIYDHKHMVCVGDYGRFDYRGETLMQFYPQR